MRGKKPEKHYEWARMSVACAVEYRSIKWYIMCRREAVIGRDNSRAVAKSAVVFIAVAALSRRFGAAESWKLSSRVDYEVERPVSVFRGNKLL